MTGKSDILAGIPCHGHPSSRNDLSPSKPCANWKETGRLLRSRPILRRSKPVKPLRCRRLATGVQGLLLVHRV